MASNYTKLWLQKTLNQGAQRRALSAIQSTGRALPCRVVAVSGALVTVAFEVDAAPLTLPQITMPKAESSWIRMPTQVGDLGVTMPADAYMGGISGLGGGTATLTRPGNLSALVFVPVSSKASPPIDQNAAQVQGPNGAIIRTTTGTTSQVVTDQNGTTLTFGSNTIKLDSSGITLTGGGKTVTINSSGVAIDGILFETHVHSGVQSGAYNSGPPV